MAITLNGSSGVTTNTTPLAQDLTVSGSYYINNAVYDTGWTYDLSNASVAHHIGTNTSAPVRIRSNNTDGIIVDSAGRVTMPYQPAFHAYNTSNDTVAANATIPFPFKDLDVGGNYNTSTSTFTAPVAGRYIFNVGFNIYTPSSSIRFFDVLMVVNGVNISAGTNRGLRGAGNYFTSGQYDGIAGSFVIELQANDTVSLAMGNANASSLQMQNDWCYFSGYLLG
jgi:hypothetical protein